MNINTPQKADFAAPLARTEDQLSPAPSFLGRAVLLAASAGVVRHLDETASRPRGRRASARAVARELFTDLLLSKPATTRTTTQLELNLA